MARSSASSTSSGTASGLRPRYLVTISGCSAAISQSAIFSNAAGSAWILVAGSKSSDDNTSVDSKASHNHSRGKVMYTGSARLAHGDFVGARNDRREVLITPHLIIPFDE